VFIDRINERFQAREKQRFYHEMSHALDLFTGGVECLGLNHHTACFDNHGPSIEPHVIQ